MADRPVKAVFLGDASQLIRETKRVEDSLRGVDKSLEQTGGKLDRINDRWGRQIKIATGIGIAALTAFAVKGVQAASALEEAQNKSNVVFGESNRLIEQFAKTSADAYGISQRAANSYAGTLGTILTVSGLTQEASAEMSINLLKLAADLASFADIEIEEALDKLRAGLVGEAEPLRTVGVLLSAARVEAKAYEAGIAAVGEQLTEAQKVQARYLVILEDTAAAQGDFTNTADSAANAARRLSARAEDQAATLGQKLLPMWEKLQQVLLKIPTPVLAVGVALLGIATAAGAVLVVLPSLAAGMALVTGASVGLAAALGALATVTLPALLVSIPLVAGAWNKHRIAQKEAEEQALRMQAAQEIALSTTYAEIQANKVAFDASVQLLEAEQNAIRAKIESIELTGDYVDRIRELGDRLRDTSERLALARERQDIWTNALKQSEAAQRASKKASEEAAAALANQQQAARNLSNEMVGLSARMIAVNFAQRLMTSPFEDAMSIWGTLPDVIHRMKVAGIQDQATEELVESLMKRAGISTSSSVGGVGGSSSSTSGASGSGALNSIDVIFKNSQARRFAGTEYLGRDLGTPGLTLRAKQDEDGGIRDVTIVVQGSIHSDRDLRDFIIEALDDYNKRTGN